MGKTLDGRSDLFSLGVTLYKLATGVTPFEGFKDHVSRNNALINGLWDPLSTRRAGLLPEFCSVVDRALALDPDERFANARQMREALEAVAINSRLTFGQSALAGYVSEDDEQRPAPPRHSAETDLWNQSTPSGPVFRARAFWSRLVEWLFAPRPVPGLLP